MLAYGWTEEMLMTAAREAGEKLDPHGNTRLMLEGVDIRSYRSRSGNCSIKFNLRFRDIPKRYKEQGEWTYPPGVSVRDWVKTKRIPIVPVPDSEMDCNLSVHNVEEIHGRRSTGTCCYHAFGYFFRALFRMMPEGTIRTALADYEGVRGFNSTYPRVGRGNAGSAAQPLMRQEMCDCHHHGVENF